MVLIARISAEDPPRDTLPGNEPGRPGTNNDGPASDILCWLKT